jgi:hypothetical protein
MTTPIRPLKTVQDVDDRLSSFVALRRVARQSDLWDDVREYSRKSDLWDDADEYTRKIDGLLKTRLDFAKHENIDQKKAA